VANEVIDEIKRRKKNYVIFKVDFEKLNSTQKKGVR